MITKRISFSLVLAGFILAAAAMLKYGQGLDIISADAAKRTIQVLVGLVLAIYGNFMPKDIGRRASSRSASRFQTALRVGGWSMTLAGLGHASLWAFAPVRYANIAATILVATALVVTMSYGFWAALGCRRSNTPSI